MQEPQPPRRKLRIRWIFAALVLLFGAWFCYQLFGPNPAIVISKETTFITEPLGPDGLPDYEAYLLEQASKGVTPENNAAVLIWQAMWPGELEQQYWLLMCDALGMEKVPSAKEGLVAPSDETVRDKIGLELAGRFSENASDDSKEDYFSEAWQKQLRDGAAYDLVGEAGARPWTSEQIPALAKWVEQNQKPLDLLVEASKRPRHYSPSPNMLDGSKDMLLAALLLDVQMMRGTQRALQVRAMWHLGEGRTAEAWGDLLACHRIARLTSENPTLVSQLVALAIDGIACNVTTQFLHHANLEAEAARQVLADLQQLGPASSCVLAMDLGERLQFLDTVLYIATDEKGPSDLANLLGIPAELAEIVCLARVDWNEVLRQGNAWFDKLVVAAKLTTREERREEFEQTDQKICKMSSRGNSPSAWVGSVLNGKRRTEMVKDVLISFMHSSTSVALIVEDRTNTQLELTRLAAALAVYRAEQGAYPEQLTELVPGVLPKLPVDLYSGKSFLYERKDDGGYLLYSVFENGIDDGGDSMSGEVIDGQWVDEQPEDFRYEESDLVIRVPVPAFEFPSSPSKEDLGYGYGYGDETNPQ